MGSDNSPFAFFEALVTAKHSIDPAFTLAVIATYSVVHEIKLKYPDLKGFEFFPVSDTIGMEDDPLISARKKGSSIAVGIRLLKKRYLDAFISAGNTGALITSATLQLPRLPGVRRPALLALLPTLTGTVAILDIGGSVTCRADHLVQFAYMGAAFQSCNQGIERPSVALLNIGIEPQKGNSAVRKAYQILSDTSNRVPLNMNFVGNVEGREVFQGGVDVIITDGFTGNVLLKASEGVSSFIFSHIEEILSEKQCDPSLSGSLQRLKKEFNYAEYPGAILCGVEGLVVKCHGSSPPRTLVNSINGAIHLVKQNVISKLKMQLEFLCGQDDSNIHRVAPTRT